MLQDSRCGEICGRSQYVTPRTSAKMLTWTDSSSKKSKFPPTSYDFVRTSRTFVEFCIDFSLTSMPSPRLSAPHATGLMRSAADTIPPSLFDLSVPYQRKARRIPGALQHMLANSGTLRYKYVCICLRWVNAY